MSQGPSRFVDPVEGRDENDGSEKAPWQTVNHALRQLTAGDTLYLREGIYYENVYCAVAGRPDAPVTVRSYPGERAVIDGGIPDFFQSPATAWVPHQAGAENEYRSARAYKNIRDVVGRFGDSMVGLQTYWHAEDLRAKNELWIRPSGGSSGAVQPVYCGPGLWYDKQSGFIHVRLAHTHLNLDGVADYRGETDPRKLPLLIAPFASVPLTVDQAMHVRFQDLVIRGGGYNAVVLKFGVDVEFEHVTIFCGTYGLRSRSTGPMRFVHSALYGMIPPWAWRTENGLYTYEPRYYDPFIPPPGLGARRNVARLPTHAVLVTEGNFEFDVFYYPHNHDWEIAHSEFTDGHDGVYLSGSEIRFHHNWVDNIQDDAIYLSSPVPYFNGNVHIYQNLITRSLMAFGCHSRGGPDGHVYAYRNIADLRGAVNISRPSAENPQGKRGSYHIFLVHGRELLGIESMYFYQNTFVSPALSGGFLHRTWANTTERTSRWVLNNVCVYLNRLPRPNARGHNIVVDGNLHWCPLPDAKAGEDYLNSVRDCEASQQAKQDYAAGWSAHSLAADPRFVKFEPAEDAANDYRLNKDSPARSRGVNLPSAWEDPLRPTDGSRPDIGALPVGSPPPKFGIKGRISFPVVPRR